MKGFPGGSAGIESCNARDPSSFPGWRRSPGEGNGNPLQKVKVLVAWKIPWMEECGGLQSTGHKESDTTEQLHLVW